jgi:predicted dehydrogenase
VIVFGYSLPSVDIEAEKVFERAVARNGDLGWIDVVNPAPEAAARFASVAGRTPVRWYPSLEALLAGDDLAA